MNRLTQDILLYHAGFLGILILSHGEFLVLYFLSFYFFQFIYMSFIIVGLGNPGAEYVDTRHNAGRIMLEFLRMHADLSEWKEDKKNQALVAKGQVAGKNVILVEPETYMNKSGVSVMKFVKSVMQAEKMAVIYDDLDLPIGTVKMSFDRGSGGHRGIESITRSIKTKAFVRIRIGISPTAPSGKMKKPSGDDVVQKHILGSFKKEEFAMLKKLSKKVNEAIELFVTEGREKAMGMLNSS